MYLLTEALIDPRSLTHWVKRVDEEDVEGLLMATIEAARCDIIGAASVDRVIIDTP